MVNKVRTFDVAVRVEVSIPLTLGEEGGLEAGNIVTNYLRHGITSENNDLKVVGLHFYGEVSPDLSGGVKDLMCDGSQYGEVERNIRPVLGLAVTLPMLRVAPGAQAKDVGLAVYVAQSQFAEVALPERAVSEIALELCKRWNRG